MILAQKAAGILSGARARWTVALGAIPFFGVVAAFGIAPDTITEPVRIERVAREIELPATAVVAAEATSASETFVREERIQRGDTVAGLLARLQIDDPEAVRFLRSDAAARPLHQLIPGKSVRVVADAENRLVGLRYLTNGNLLAVDRAAAGFSAEYKPAALETRTHMRSGEIRSSLFAATDAAGLSDAVAQQLADIFGGDIDFHRDLRKGDRFAVVYEALFHAGEPIRTGRVLAAEFVNQGKAYHAIWFEHADGQGGYYNLEGKNLRKQFLRSPIEFSRISSGFSMRFHPILQTWRAHKGIDYAAPVGTRVRATADGVVEQVVRHGAYGNLVVLRHQSKYTTWYAHLSGFAKGLAKGKRVSQGDTIGFVGATGLATGPHLHYEFRVSDVHQNPLRVAMPSAPPILPQQKPEFDSVARPLEQRLALLRGVNLAAAE